MIETADLMNTNKWKKLPYSGLVSHQYRYIIRAEIAILFIPYFAL